MYLYSDHDINRTKLFLHQYIEATMHQQEKLLTNSFKVADDPQYVYRAS